MALSRRLACFLAARRFLRSSFRFGLEGFGAEAPAEPIAAEREKTLGRPVGSADFLSGAGTFLSICSLTIPLARRTKSPFK